MGSVHTHSAAVVVVVHRSVAVRLLLVSSLHWPRWLARDKSANEVQGWHIHTLEWPLMAPLTMQMGHLLKEAHFTEDCRCFWPHYSFTTRLCSTREHRISMHVSQIFCTECQFKWTNIEWTTQQHMGTTPAMHCWEWRPHLGHPCDSSSIRICLFCLFK